MPEFQPKALVVDLETTPAGDTKPARILMMGALRADTGVELELKVSKQVLLQQGLDQLDIMTEGASFVLGHNLLLHDRPILEQANHRLKLLSLPVIDTLRLSPLAFPQNPYHRLIKDYKLVRDSLNSPLKDCRSTLTLFADQHEAFIYLGEVRQKELLCYQGLLAPSTESGLGAFFAELTGQAPLPLEKIRELVPDLLEETDPTLSRGLKVCRTRLQRLLDEDLRLPELHWPIAYTLAWLRVSGGNSVLAPWVYHQFPETERLLHELRDIPCTQLDCQYCQTTHDPRQELKRFFGFDDFRYETPESSLQHDTVLAGMRGENVLAVLPTGGGKSLCYQLPALNRYQRNGSLTVIISPLQSLMKDQVDGLLDRNLGCAAALNGLLSMPERADVLDKIQMGDIGILLVSPEQFRNSAFRRVVTQRRIGAWIFDEAHCLSKWGNDFRPDYLYVARFIRELTGEGSLLAPIGCFTATAKPDVLDDIRHHFRDALGVEFRSILGSPERTNLSFDVMPCSQQEKRGRILALLDEHLGDQPGGAVVFVASRKKAEEVASFIADQQWSCHHFHAGLEPNEKKDIQDAFKSGRLRIIVATNAFGMGVDKADIRLVVHADIPGSLENYLQEAGRAGRDQQDARCILLYDPHDIETQFGLSERSRLTYRDIQQILRKLRFESTKRNGKPLVITAGEILQDEAVETSFDSVDRDAETKVSTAVAWLERGDYLKRQANVTRIFPARLGLSEDKAQQKLLEADLPERKRQEFEVILNYLQHADPDERISTDSLMQLTSQTHEEIAGILQQMESLGLLINDTQITVYIRHGVVDASEQRLSRTLSLESALFKQLSELAPDAEHGDWQDLCLSELTSLLKERADLPDLVPPQVRQLLKSLSRDKTNNSSHRSTFEIRSVSHDYLKLRILSGMTWRQVERLGERRRTLASLMLRFLISKLPSDMRSKDALAETTFGELEQVIDTDLELKSRVKPEERRRAIEHVLLYLHQQGVVALNHGMTVMRRAMTIEVNQEKKGRYLKDDFRKLDEHYRERIIQVHVMREYATMALHEMADALRLVIDYFSQRKEDFIRRYFSRKGDVLKRATSEESWRAIVDPMSTSQRQAVVDDKDDNLLILAGPGSGKTRVIVHRIAYLLRVRRVPADAIVALTFNRHAANEIRKRLKSLVGKDAYGVTVLTYHALAMRMTGIRFQRNEPIDERRLQDILRQAVDLLEGNQMQTDGQDELREQLLRGYRYILVDEYQDIDELQYRLVSALAGRHVDEEERLCILAVGDDDQNIYAWRNTSNRYIERFREDYQASIHYLVENFRSTHHIVNAANELISQIPGRLKQDHPIHIDEGRSKRPPGGEWEVRDALGKGKVLRLIIPASDRIEGNLQAQAALSRLQTLMEAGSVEWSDFAILARSHKYLLPIQAWCEQHEVPYHLAADKSRTPSLTRHREFVRLVECLQSESEPVPVASIQQFVNSLALDPDWYEVLMEAVDQLQFEFSGASLVRRVIVDWLYDYFREVRERPKAGLYLGTVHSAKGLEFSHVVLLDGDWPSVTKASEEERRLYYVGMTRAAQTLTLCEFSEGNPFSTLLGSSTLQSDWHGNYCPDLRKRYRALSLSDIDIGYAGRQTAQARIHGDINGLRIGDALTWQERDGRYQLFDAQGNLVGRTSAGFRLDGSIESSEVVAIVVRYAEDSEEPFRSRCKVERWEVVVPRMTLAPEE